MQKAVVTSHSKENVVLVYKDEVTDFKMLQNQFRYSTILFVKFQYLQWTIKIILIYKSEFFTNKNIFFIEAIVFQFLVNF